MKQTPFAKTAISIARHSQLAQTDLFLQHGNTSCLLHTVAVAYYAYRFFRKFRFFKIHEEDLIRGALLHDYFLYDWHIPDKSHPLHGFRHPKTALQNAENDFSLTRIERDIIVKHMFPLTLRPPKFCESVAVCIADKICSVYEVFNRRPYQNKALRSVYQSIKNA